MSRWLRWRCWCEHAGRDPNVELNAQGADLERRGLLLQALAQPLACWCWRVAFVGVAAQGAQAGMVWTNGGVLFFTSFTVHPWHADRG